MQSNVVKQVHQIVCEGSKRDLEELLYGEDGVNNEVERVLADKENLLLHEACWRGDEDLVTFLSAYTDINVASAKGTPLLIACCQGFAHIVDILLLNEPDLLLPDKKTPPDKCAFCCAASAGFVDVLKALITHKPEFWDGEDGCSVVLKCASQYGHTNVLKYICDFKQEQDTSISGDLLDTLLSTACQYKQVCVMKYLVSKGRVLSTPLVSQYHESIGALLAKQVTEETDGPSVTVLSWSRQQLCALHPAWFERYKSVKRVSVDLSKNQLTVLSGFLPWSMPNIISVNVSENRLSQISPPNSAIVCTSLSDLSLSRNQLASVPKDLFSLPNLTTLDLSHNAIQTLAPPISDAPPPSRRSDSMNRRRGISISLCSEASFDLNSAWTCFKLETLDVSHNKLTSLPEQLHSLGKLKTLRANNNELEQFVSPWQCPLQLLDLSSNKLTELSERFSVWENTLIKLSVRDNKIREIHQAVVGLANVEYLDLSYNWLQDLPPLACWKCSSLETLDLSHNFFCYVDDHRRPSRSPVHDFMKKLFTREIDPTDVSDVVLEREPTKSLELPGELFAESLSELNLSYNRLAGVPTSIAKISMLRRLNLSHNSEICYLPPELCKLPHLYHLDLQNTRPQNIRRALLTNENESTKNVLAHLKQQLTSSSAYTCVKLMVVGRQSKGKTSLVNALREHKSQRTVSTNGIEIHDWKLLGRKMARKIPKRNTYPDVTLKMWDFAGQQDFYVTHKVFLSPYGLYLLVYDLRLHVEGVRQLRPWLLDIQAHAENSHVILVGTFLDCLDDAGRQNISAIHDYIIKEYKNQAGFPEIAKWIEISCTDGSNLDKLCAAIYEEAVSIKVKVSTGAGHIREPLVGRLVPKSYLDLQKQLEKEADRRKKNKDWMIFTRGEYIEFISQSDVGITAAEDINLATSFLAEVGSIVHVTGYSELICISPQWLADKLAEIVTIDAANRMVKNGILLLSEACKMRQWTDDAFFKLVDVLEVFEIALQIENDQLLIPSKLPLEKPGRASIHDSGSDSGFQNKTTVYRLYQMDYMPSGFLSRLITQILFMLKQAKRSAKSIDISAVSHIYNIMRDHSKPVKTTYWQEGILIEYGSTEVVVETASPYYTTGDEGVLITVNCTDNPSILGFVTDIVDNLITQWYPGLEDTGLENSHMRRLVPCPGCMRKHRGKLGKSVHLFGLIGCILLVMKDKNKQLSCTKCGIEHIPVQDLIPDVLLNDLPGNLHLGNDQVKFDPEKDFLARGGEGSVYRGQINGVDVAFKELLVKQMQRKLDSGYSGGRLSSEKSGKSSGSSGSCDSHSSVSTQYSSPSGLIKAKIVSSYRSLRQEVTLLHRLRHPCLISLLGVNAYQLCYALELCPHGSLHKLAMEKKKSCAQGECVLGRTLSFRILYQIALGLRYLHSMGIVYKDLKGDNVLVWSVSLDDQVNIKLSDYGLSRSISPQGLKGFEGTYGYQAPEMRYGIYDQKVDIFAYGIVISEVLSGEMPFMNLPSVEIPKAIMKGRRPSIAVHEADPKMPKLIELMVESWQETAEDRPSAATLVQVMKQPAFSHLYDITQLPSVINEVTCVFMSQQDDNSYLRFWARQGSFRSYYVRNIATGVYKVKQENMRGTEVLCMDKVDPYLIIGTKKGEVEVLQNDKSTGNLVAASTPAKCGSSPLCMTHNISERGDRILLLIGLKNGKLNIYSLDKTGKAPIFLQCISEITINEGSPVVCIADIETRNEIWMACGNELVVLAASDITGRNPNLGRISHPVASKDQMISQICCQGDQLWVRVDGSSAVTEYDVDSRQVVCHFDCGKHLSIGDLLTTQEVKKSSSPMPPSPSILSDKTRTAVLRQEGRSLRRKISQVKSISSKKKKRDAVEEYFRAEVRSIAFTEGTLWLGLKTGEVVVSNVTPDNVHGFQHGEVLAVLDTGILKTPCISSSVSYLSILPGDFVACLHEQVSTNAETEMSHPLVTWQSCDLDTWWRERQAVENFGK